MIDTASKRASMLKFACGRYARLQVPDGTTAVDDRLTLLGLYGGIGASGEVAEVVTTQSAAAVRRRSLYVVSVGGVEYVVETLAEAEALARANTPTVEQLEPEAPLPKFTVTMPEEQHKKIALPRAQVGIRKLV